MIIPITAVRSAGKITAAKKAERGPTSIDCVHALRIRNIIARGRNGGNGIKARKIAEGKWVKTIVSRCELVQEHIREVVVTYFYISNSL